MAGLARHRPQLDPVRWWHHRSPHTHAAVAAWTRSMSSSTIDSCVSNVSSCHGAATRAVTSWSAPHVATDGSDSVILTTYRPQLVANTAHLRAKCSRTLSEGKCPSALGQLEGLCPILLSFSSLGAFWRLPFHLKFEFTVYVRILIYFYYITT